MTVLRVATIGLSLIFGCFGHKSAKFPTDFQFGASTAAFAIEGGWNADGKGPSYWDWIVHNETHLIVSDLPKQEIIKQAEVAADSYHKWREDIKIAKELGLNFYRFSIACPRIFPRGFSYPINQAGIDYYNNLINGLLAEGITPIVTMYYYDGPETGILYFGGYSNSISVKTFVDYADFLFRTFGDRVKQWTTFNEPNKECKETYGELLGGNYEYFPRGQYEYLCARHVILSHAGAYRLYEKKYKQHQNGTISMSLALDWYESVNAVDFEASLRAMDFSFGWFANPLIYGDYPESMIIAIAEVSRLQNYNESRLPPFSEEEKKLIKGTLDFIVLIHRNTYAVTNRFEIDFPPSAQNDVQIKRSFKKEWVDPNSIYTTTPWGFRKSIKYVSVNYRQPVISVTAVGYGAFNDSLKDEYRVKKLQQLLEQVSLLINEDNVNIRDVSVWSLIDSFYFQYATTVKYGLYQVDFKDPARPRTPKQSAKYYKKVIETRNYKFN